LGHITVKVIIRGKEEYVANLPVDAGASFTVLPLKLAEKLLPQVRLRQFDAIQ